MKNNQFTKISLVVLTLALCIGAVFAMSVSATNNDDGKKPEIISQNLRYSEKFQLMYAVDTASVAEGAVTLNVYNADPSVNPAIPIATMTAEAPTTDPEILGNLGVDSAYVFTTTAGVSYTNMATNYYAVAEDSQGNKSDVKRYSVAEYFYERLSSADATPAQVRLYKASLSFGTEVQIAVGKMADNDENLISNLRYIVVDGGTVGGYASGLYPIGATVTPSAQGISNWNFVTSGASGEQLDTGNKITSFQVPDTEGLYKIMFTTGAVFSYPKGYDNLNDYNPGDTLPTFLAKGNTNLTELNLVQTFDGHGTVAKAEFTNNNTRLLIKPVGSQITASEATAYEISFDMKIDSTQVGGTDRTKKFTFRWNKKDTSTALYLPDIYPFRTESEDLYLRYYYSSTKDVSTTYEGVNLREWTHFRIVVYKNSSDLCIYINGAETPFVFTGFAYSNFDGTDLTWLDGDFYIIGYDGLITDGYIDNVFRGYIVEDKPITD